MGGVRGRVKKTGRLIAEHMPDAGRFLSLIIFIDVVWATILYGGAIDDYFYYNFYQRRHSARKNFNTWRKRKQIINACNDREDREIFNDKSRFNETFSLYLGREWLDLSRCSYRDFAAFVRSNPRFIVKPPVGSFGQGVRLVEAAAGDLPSLFADLRREGLLAEEYISQLAELAQFNPSSVNTLRIMTLLAADGRVRVLTAALRCGNGPQCADNLSLGGIASLVDTATGLVTTPGIDLRCRRYIRHPQSGKELVGFQVPFWERIMAIVKAAARVVPTVRYVGWDVALGRSGTVHLVEGNAAADADVTEMPDQIGKWPLDRDELKKIARLTLGQEKKEKDPGPASLLPEGDPVHRLSGRE